MKQFINKCKQIFNIALLAKMIVIALIIILTLFPSLFDPENADWKKVASNFVISIMIVMMSFIAQLFSSKNREMAKEEYITASTNHINQIRLIQKKQLSHLHKLYVSDENEKNKLAYTKDVFGQFEIDIKYLTMDLELVKTALKHNKIDKEQYSVIQLCRKGRIEYDKYDIRDLTATQIMKKGRNTNKSQQAVITASNLLGKVSWMLAFAVIWGMFAWDSTQHGVSGQAWIDLGSRLFTFAGGLWTGDVTGKECVQDDIRLFDVFYNFNSKFVQDFENKIWKPKEDELEEDIIEHLMQLQKADEEQEKTSEEIQEIELTAEQFAELQQKGAI